MGNIYDLKVSIISYWPYIQGGRYLSYVIGHILKVTNIYIVGRFINGESYVSLMLQKIESHWWLFDDGENYPVWDNLFNAAT